MAPVLAGDVASALSSSGEIALLVKSFLCQLSGIQKI